eukprot:4532626-Amphidinium_carterae.1
MFAVQEISLEDIDGLFGHDVATLVEGETKAPWMCLSRSRQCILPTHSVDIVVGVRVDESQSHINRELVHRSIGC